MGSGNVLCLFSNVTAFLLQVLHMLNSILLPKYSWKFVLGSMPTKEPERKQSCPPSSLRAPSKVPAASFRVWAEYTPARWSSKAGGWGGVMGEWPKPGPHSWVCMGNAVVAVDTGQERTTASCPKMPDQGKRWDAFVSPGAALLPLALQTGHSSVSVNW